MNFTQSAFFYLTLVSLSSIIFSCAPSKKQTYMQEANVNHLQESKYLEKDLEYKLQPGDIIAIQVTSLTPADFNFFEGINELDARLDPLLTGYELDQEGYIVLPQIGSVLVKDLTIREVQDQVKTVLQDYLDSPTVYIRLISFHFTVIGEVTRAGKFSVFDSKVNILEAIGLAGGLTEYANYEQVKVLRSNNGVSTLSFVNLLHADLPSSPKYYLEPNDVVIVDQLKNKNFRRNSSSNVTLIFSGIATIATILLAFDRL